MLRDAVKKAATPIKVAISVVLLAYLLKNTDLAALHQRVRTGDLLLLVAAASLYVAIMAIQTWRWRVLLKAQGFPAPLRHLSASYLVATFFNNFLPSNIGGDVIRVRDSSKLTGSTTASLAIVAIDRIVGFGGLFAVAATAFVLGGPEVRALAGARAALLSLTLVFGALAYVFFRPGTARRVMAASGLNRFDWAKQRFETVQQAVHVYREEVGAVWLAFLVSVVVQALLVGYYWFIAHSLRVQLAFSACLLMVPLCVLVQAVPISFNGWGIREGVFIYYFGQVGLPKDSALAFSITGAALIVLLSLSGAVVWTSRGPLAAEASPS